MKHSVFVKQLFSQPGRIEHHFKAIRQEFAIGHGRIDLIGIDVNGSLCFVEVKTKDADLTEGKKQIKRYRDELLQFLGIVGVAVSIRGIVVTPNKIADVGTKTSVPIPGVTPKDIPTSHELFGLKGAVTA